MADVKKSGKVLLRGVDGAQATGVCVYSSSPESFEATVSAGIAGGAAQAVLQYGPEKGYTCRPPESISKTLRCGAGVAAVWVVSEGKPALFGRIGAGPFDATEARRKLLDALQLKNQAQSAVKAAGLPASPAAANPMVKPANREPSGGEQAVPFPAPNEHGRSLRTQKDEQYPQARDKAESPILLLQPGSQPAQKGAEPKPAVHPAAAVSAAQQAKAPAAPPQAVKAASAPAQVIAASAPAAKPQPRAPLPPLVVKRAPRPTPRPPVYSPLWDDVSVEFEKMLDTLPQAHPFSGEAREARIAEMPTSDAVQCYVGSVEVDGMKIFLQAVPARPYSRPAGFDHSLVSRSGECYWVKYFIQND